MSNDDSFTFAWAVFDGWCSCGGGCSSTLLLLLLQRKHRKFSDLTYLFSVWKKKSMREVPHLSSLVKVIPDTTAMLVGGLLAVGATKEGRREVGGGWRRGGWCCKYNYINLTVYCIQYKWNTGADCEAVWPGFPLMTFYVCVESTTHNPVDV